MAGTVYIVIYTLYHHIYKLALEIQKGLEEAGVKTKIFQGNPKSCPIHSLLGITDKRDALQSQRPSQMRFYKRCTHLQSQTFLSSRWKNLPNQMVSSLVSA